LWHASSGAVLDLQNCAGEEFDAGSPEPAIEFHAGKSALHGDRSLPDDVAIVHPLAHPVNGHPRLAVIIEIGPEERIGTAMAGKKRRVDVDCAELRECQHLSPKNRRK